MQSFELQSAFFRFIVCDFYMVIFFWSNHSWCQCVRESGYVTYTIKSYTWNAAFLIDIIIILCDENCLLNTSNDITFHIGIRFRYRLKLNKKRTFISRRKNRACPRLWNSEHKIKCWNKGKKQQFIFRRKFEFTSKRFGCQWVSHSRWINQVSLYFAES